MTHDTFREQIPLYVVGALDGDELRAFERYVAEHRPVCEKELAEWQSVADQIAQSVPPVEPSRAVFYRIMADVEEEISPRPKPVVVGTAPREPVNLTAVLFRWLPWAAAAVLVAMTAVMIKQTNVMRERFTSGQQTSTTQQTRNATLEKANALQAVKIAEQEVALTNLAIRVASQSKEFLEQGEVWKARTEKQRQEIDTLQTANTLLTEQKDELQRAATELRRQLDDQRVQVASLEKQLGEQSDGATRGRTQIAELEARLAGQQDTLNLVMDPAIRVSPLANPDPKKGSAATGYVYWHSAKKTGYILVANLDPVQKGSGKSLELWGICGKDKPVAGTVFWTDAAGRGAYPIKLSGDIACLDKFAVTVEPTDGEPLPAPTGTMVLLSK